MKQKETIFAGLLAIVMLAVLGLVSLPLQSISSEGQSTSGSVATTTVTTLPSATANQTSTSSTSITASGQSSAQEEALPTYTINAVLVDRICTNSSPIATTSPSSTTVPVKFGADSFGGSQMIVAVTNQGSSPLDVQAVCVDGAGIAPGQTTALLTVSPNNPIQPGQDANVTLNFGLGAGVYGNPPRSFSFNVITGSGEMASDPIIVCCGLVTQESSTPLISVQNASLVIGTYLGSSPELSASMVFNGTEPPQTLELDLNGTYIGTLGFTTVFTNFETRLSVGIVDSAVAIQPGKTCTVTFIVTFAGFVTSSTTTSVVIGGASVTSPSTDNLSLGLSLNSTDIQQGSKISVIVQETNTLEHQNNVSSSSAWPLVTAGSVSSHGPSQRVFSVGPCGTANLPMGWAITRGNLAADNLTSANWLDLYEPGRYECGPILSGIDSYLFQPSSDAAAIYGSCDPNPCGPAYPTAAYANFGGWWNGSTFSAFTPGVYTVVAGDEWGATAILHFDVENMTLQSFSLCPSNCIYPSPYLSGEISLQGPQLVKNLELFVNGTDEGGLGHGIANTNVIYLYKGSFQYPKVTSGATYTITFVATYVDNLTLSAMMVVKA